MTLQSSTEGLYFHQEARGVVVYHQGQTVVVVVALYRGRGSIMCSRLADEMINWC